MLNHPLEAWRTSQQITLYLIDQISVDGLKSTLSKHGRRDVVSQFAHMHNVSVWQLQKRAEDLATPLATFETKLSPGKDELK